jgi:hypothetical protein
VSGGGSSFEAVTSYEADRVGSAQGFGMTLQDELETALWSILPYAEEHRDRVRSVAWRGSDYGTRSQDVDEALERARDVLRRCQEVRGVEVSSTKPSEWDRLSEDESGPLA